jgi:hypothetical protein
LYMTQPFYSFALYFCYYVRSVKQLFLHWFGFSTHYLYILDHIFYQKMYISIF